MCQKMSSMMSRENNLVRLFPSDKIKLGSEQTVYDVLVMCATRVGIKQSSFQFFILVTNDHFPILPYKKKLPFIGGPFVFRIIDINISVDDLSEIDPHCLCYLYHQAISDIQIKSELRKENKFDAACNLIALQIAKFSKELDHVESIEEILDLYIKTFDCSPFPNTQKIMLIIKERLKEYMKLKTELCCIKEYLKLFFANFQFDVDPIGKKFSIKMSSYNNLSANSITLSKENFILHHSSSVSKSVNYDEVKEIVSKEQLTIHFIKGDPLKIIITSDNKSLKSMTCLFDYYSRLADDSKLVVNISEIIKKIEPTTLKFVISAPYNLIRQNHLTSYCSDYEEAENVLNSLPNGWFMITWQEQYQFFCLSCAMQGTTKRFTLINEHGSYYIKGQSARFTDLEMLIRRIYIPVQDGNSFQLVNRLTDFVLLDMNNKKDISYEIPEIFIKMDPVPIATNWISRVYQGSFKMVTGIINMEMNCFEYPISCMQTKTREGYKQTMKQLISFKHDHVLQTIGFCQSLGSGIFRCITENWSDGTTLQEYLTTSSSSITDLLKIGRQAGSALTFLHSKNIYHGCPSPSYLYIDTKSFIVKLAEVGVVDNIMIHHGGEINPFCSPSHVNSMYCLLRWMPQLYVKFPEFKENRISADRWCYGCTLWQIFNKGDLPLAHVTDQELLDTYEKIKTSQSSTSWVPQVEWFKTELTMPNQDRKINKKLQIIINYLLDPGSKPAEELDTVIELYNLITAAADDKLFPSSIDIRVQKIENTLLWTEPLKTSTFLARPNDIVAQFRPNDFDSLFFSSASGAKSSYTLANPLCHHQFTNYGGLDFTQFEDEPLQLDTTKMSLLCPGNEDILKKPPQRTVTDGYSQEMNSVVVNHPNLVFDDVVNTFEGGETLKWHTQFLEEDFKMYSSCDLEIGDEIGKGHFGVVKRANLKKDDEEVCEVAVKVFDLGNIATTETLRQDIRKEARAMKTLVHSNIVPLIGICDDEANEIGLIMPLYSLGSLAKYLKDNRNMIKTPRLSSFGSQISDGMKYLVSKGFVHRDLALRNILVQNYTKVRIADLGLSREVSKDYYYITKNKKIDIPFMCYPPEYFKTQRYDKWCDVWSYGIMCWEMFAYGKTPYSDQGIRDIPALEKFLSSQRLEPPEGTPPVYKTVMKMCWLPKAKRWNFDQIYCYISDNLQKTSYLKNAQYASVARTEDTITTDINDDERTVEFNYNSTKILQPSDISDKYKTSSLIPCSLFPPLQHVLVRSRALYSPCNDIHEMLECEEGEPYQVLLSLSHSNLVQMLGILIDNKNTLVLLYPFYTLGTLDVYCRKNLDIKNFKIRTDFGRQIANGMNYLTRNKVIHSDCNLCNVFVKTADSVVIAEYGLDRIGAVDKELMRLYPVSYTYPPEVLKLVVEEQALNFNLESVVWSYGVLLWELFSLQIPYQHILTDSSDLPVVEQIYNFLKETRLYVEQGWPDCIKTIISDCWTDRDTRISFEQMIKLYDYNNQYYVGGRR